MIVILNPEKHVELLFHESDPGYCRVYFKTAHNGRLVCFQECGYGSEVDFELLHASRDGEPSHPAPIETIKSVQLPDNARPKNYLSTHFRRWLEETRSQLQEKRGD